jgi:ferrous iron transport protein A
LRFISVSKMPAKPRTIATLPLGVEAVIRRVGSARPIARRLLELGLVPGTRISITRVAPLGDPLELRLRNYSLSIRRAEAAVIEVDEPSR